MPGVPKNVPTLPPGWSGDYSWFDKPFGHYLFFFVFMTLMLLLVGSLKLAWEGNFLMSAILATIFASSILAILAYAWFRLRIPDEPPED